MQIITRQNYASQIDTWIGKEQIIVLIGQRRVGKSYVMKDFVQRHQQEPDANIIYIDKEKIAFKYITNNDELEDYIAQHFVIWPSAIVLGVVGALAPEHLLVRLADQLS